MARRGHPAGRLRRGARGALREPTPEACCDALARARPAGVRQAGPAGLLGRDRPGGRRRRARRRAGGGVRARPAGDRRGGCAAGSRSSARCSGNGEPVASQPGEILLAAGEGGWYDYEAKYTPGGMQLIVPARVPASAASASASWRVTTFPPPAARPGAGRLLRRRRARCSSTSSTRCPASRRTSVYASLFEASGVPTRSCSTGCCRLALERHAERRATRSRRTARPQSPRRLVYGRAGGAQLLSASSVSSAIGPLPGPVAAW